MKYKNVPICVNAIIITNKGIMLGKRGFAPEKGEFAAIGGFVEEGESLEEALSREVKEEIGCKVVESSYWKSSPSTYNGRTILDTFFLVTISGKPKKSKEITDFKFVNQYGI